MDNDTHIGSGSGDSAAALSPSRLFIAAGILAVLTLAVFFPVFLAGPDFVLSRFGTDLSQQFLPWREFGFGQLRQGRLALWNPHIFAGAPYFGGFQSALLYPPNWLHLLLPLPVAVNAGILFHVFLAGLFMYLWAGWRRLHWLACLGAGVMFMFCGAFFPHVYAGHLANVCAMVWAPLIFLAIDGEFAQPSLKWLLLGVFAIAMQILAGHPQYVFYTGVAAAVYCGLRISGEKRWLAITGGLAAMCAGAVGLTAVQLFTGFEASSECVRSAGLPFAWAAMFSFPPENLLTLLAPGFFGTGAGSLYWGRCYIWEMLFFIGVPGLVLAGVAAGRWRERPVRTLLLAAAVMLVLAFGSHTPLFGLLYDHVPGFNLFRAWAKFLFPASLFLVLLAAIGFDTLLRSPAAISRRLLWGLGLTGGAVIVAGLLVAYGTLFNAAWWMDVATAPFRTGETYLVPMELREGFDLLAGLRAGAELGKTLVVLIVLMQVLLWLRSANAVVRRRAAGLLFLLLTAEMTIFAHTYVTGFRLAQALPLELRQFAATLPTDCRLLNRAAPNSAMSLGVYDLWGMDPGVTRRYAEFMAFTQGENPDTATQYLTLRVLNPLFELVRGRYIVLPENGVLRVLEDKDALPRLLLIRHWRELGGRDEIFHALAMKEFDPRQTVILETAPDPAPLRDTDPSGASGGTPAAPGTARIVSETTDAVTIEADVTTPALLVMTDLWTAGWRVRPLPGSVQARYRLQPADYILRAVPLVAGRHRFVVEYRPTAFIVGAWVSVATLPVYFAGCLWLFIRRRTTTAAARSLEAVYDGFLFGKPT